jgi:hypothetical protein
VAQSDIVDYADVVTMDDLKALPPEARRAIKSVTKHMDEDGRVVSVEITLWDKVTALAQLARATGMHVSRAEINAAVNVTVEDKSAAHARLFAQLDAIAGRLPAPSETPLLIDVTPIKEKDDIDD